MPSKSDYFDRMVLQAELREARLEMESLDALKRAANRASYRRDIRIGWDKAWDLYTETERVKKGAE